MKANMTSRTKTKELARTHLGQPEEVIERIALCYVRVSSIKQKDDGNGLESQEHRARQFAQRNGWPVEQVFSDVKTAKGDFLNRPGVVELLQYVRDNRHKRYVVVFDDLKRLTRDTEYYWPFLRALKKYDVVLQSPNFHFEDTPEGKWSQTMFVATGQLEREQNARQTLQKMKARVERGYTISKAPFGYKYAKTKDSGRVLVVDEPRASIIRELLEGYASGRFANQAEAGEWLSAQPEFPKAAGIQRVTDILTRLTYAGMVEMPEWGISLRKAQHQPLISYETYQKIQDKIAGNAKTPKRRDINREFVLRGYVECGCCGSPLTSCFSKSYNGSYHPYYLFRQRGCEHYGKSIRRDVLEGEFGEVVKQLQPSETIVRTSEAMFSRLWDHLAATQKDRVRSLRVQLARIEADTQDYVDRIVQTKVQAVITAIEDRIQMLAKDKALTEERIENCGRPLKSYDDALRTAVAFVSNPEKMWLSEHFDDKRTLLKLAFPKRIQYVRNQGFRTADPSLPFKVLGKFSDRKKSMVPEVGVEPTRF